MYENNTPPPLFIELIKNPLKTYVSFASRLQKSKLLRTFKRIKITNLCYSSGHGSRLRQKFFKNIGLIMI